MRSVNLSLKNYAACVAARTPAPGGGSVSAFGGALGVALLSMVIRYTIGKEKYKPYEKFLRHALKTCQQLQKKLLLFVDKDSIAYKKVAQAKSLGCENAYQKALKQSALVSYEIADACCQAIALCNALIAKTTRSLRGDLICAAHFLDAACQGTLENVRSNLYRVNDRNFVSRQQRLAAQRLQFCVKTKQSISARLQHRLHR